MFSKNSIFVHFTLREYGCSSSTLSGCFQDFLKYQHPLLLASLINMVFYTQLLRSCSVHRKRRCCFLRYSWNFYFVSLHLIFFFTPQLGDPWIQRPLCVFQSRLSSWFMRRNVWMKVWMCVHVFVTELRKQSCPWIQVVSVCIHTVHSTLHSFHMMSRVLSLRLLYVVTDRQEMIIL